MYAALRDCLAALRLDPGHVKAQLRLVQCLVDLDWLSEASRCLENFKVRHPEFIKSKAFTQLQGDLQAAKAKKDLKPNKIRLVQLAGLVLVRSLGFPENFQGGRSPG